MQKSPSSLKPSAPPEDTYEEHLETQPLLTHEDPTDVINHSINEEEGQEVQLDSPTIYETCLVTCMHYCDYVVTLNMLFFVIAASGAVLYYSTNILRAYPAVMDFYVILYLFVFMYFFVVCVRKCYDC